MIAKKMKAGESAGNIIKSILGASDDQNEQDDNNKEGYIIEDDKALPSSEDNDKFNAFATDPKMKKELHGYG